MVHELTLTYACGHSVTHRWSRSGADRPYRNNAHRDQMIAEASVGYCDACARRRENEMAAREAALDRLTPLEGTPRQVAWATTIRSDRLPSLREAIASGAYLEERVHLGWTGEPSDVYKTVRTLRAKYPTFDLAAEVLREVLDTSQATWWINTGSRRDHDLLIEIAAEVLSDLDRGGGRAKNPAPKSGSPRVLLGLNPR